MLNMCILCFNQSSWSLQRINIKKSIMKWTKGLATMYICQSIALQILSVLDPLIFLSAAYGLHHFIIIDIHWLDIAVIGKFIKQYVHWATSACIVWGKLIQYTHYDRYNSINLAFRVVYVIVNAPLQGLYVVTLFHTLLILIGVH